MELLIHHLNPIASTTVRTDTDAIWVGLNSDTSLIPDSAIIFKTYPTPVGALTTFPTPAKPYPSTMPEILTGTGSRNSGPPGRLPLSFHNSNRGMTSWKLQCRLKSRWEDGVWQRFNTNNAHSTSLKSRPAFVTSSTLTSACLAVLQYQESSLTTS